MNKPKTVCGDLAHLPPALKPLVEIDHWLIWQWEWRRGVWTKPPYCAEAPGNHAKNNDPSTWASHPAAVAAAQTAKADGIGFALLDTPFDVVDLDRCVDPGSGQIDPWAKIWLTQANGSYIEVTPSGEGLRIIGGTSPENTGKLHRRWKVEGGREGAGVEIYRNCERYITITGAQIGECRELEQVNLLEQIKAHYGGGKSDGKKDNGGSGTGFDFNQAGAASSTGTTDWDAVIQTGAAPGADVSAVFHSVVGHLSAKGLSAKEIVDELGKWPSGIGQRYSGRLQQEVERSYDKWQDKQLRISVHSGPEEGKQGGGAQNEEEPPEEMVWAGVRKGVPLSNGTNTRRGLRALGVLCRYDIFHDKIEVRGKNLVESGNLDHIALMLRIKIHKAFKFDPGTRHVFDAMIQLAIENKFDPVANYLNALVWDGTPRLDHWLATYLGATDTELNREFGRIALIAAVRRVRHPGMKFDSIIVLEGLMGTQKSKAIETMAGTENFSDQTILGARDREQQELLAGVWLFEIAELSNIRKTEVEHIKAFASRTHDRARPVYGRTRVDQPRRCVLFATTNDDQYLKVADRRFWPVSTTTIDIDSLKRDRDQLWAEAAQQERGGASIVLDRSLWGSAYVEQTAREEHDPWDDILSGVVGTVEQGEERVFSRDLLKTVLEFQTSRLLDRDSKRLSRCMRRLGWEGPKVVRIGQERTSGYTRLVKET